MAEGDSPCVIRCASGSCFTFWVQAGVVEDVHDLAREFKISYVHILRRENTVADSEVRKVAGDCSLLERR